MTAPLHACSVGRHLRAVLSGDKHRMRRRGLRPEGLVVVEIAPWPRQASCFSLPFAVWRARL